MAKSLAAYLEVDEPDPPDLDAWLADWGFNLDKPIQSQRDSDGWRWWFQEVEEKSGE